MNNTLYYSSILAGIAILCISILGYNRKWIPLYVATYIAIFTSIVNHGTTNQIARIMDRVTICIVAIIYLYYISRIGDFRYKFAAYSILGIMILSYFYSKTLSLIKISPGVNLPDKNQTHFLSHMLAVVLFGILTVSLPR